MKKYLNESIECQGYYYWCSSRGKFKASQERYKSAKQIICKFGHKHAVAHAHLHTQLDMFGHVLITSMSFCY